MKKTIADSRFKQLSEQMASEFSRVNEIALAYINGRLPEVYTINYNLQKNSFL